MLLRVMLAGLVGLVVVLFVLSDWVWIGRSSGGGIHARSICSRAKLAKRCSKLTVWGTRSRVSVKYRLEVCSEDDVFCRRGWGLQSCYEVVSDG